MQRMTTLKPLIILLAFSAFSVPAFTQDYNNIEFIENKGQWDSRVKFKGEFNTGAVFVRSTGFTILQHNQQDYEALQSLTHGHNNRPPGTISKSSVANSTTMIK